MWSNKWEERTGTNEYHQTLTQEPFDQPRYNLERQGNSKRQGRFDFYTETRGNVLPTREKTGIDRAFPLKPVHHKKTVSLRTQDLLDPFEKIYSGNKGRNMKNCNKSPTEVSLLSKECLSNCNRDIAVYQRPKKDLHRLPDEQWQLAKAIHEKQLFVQEKLCRMEEMLRQNLKKERATSGDDKKKEEEWQGRKRAEEEKYRMETRVAPSEQWRRETARVRCNETQEVNKQQRRRQDEWYQGRMKNSHEEEWARLSQAGILGKPQPSRDRRAEMVTDYERRENRELSRWKKDMVKENEQNQVKRREEKDNRIGRGMGKRSQQENEKEKDGERSSRMPEKDFSRNMDKKVEKLHEERESKAGSTSSCDERKQSMPQLGQWKSAQRLVTQHNDNERRTSKVPSQPSVAGLPHSSEPQWVELSPRESLDTCRQQLPCKICHRTFAAERLEKHHEICKKFRGSHRKVFDSFSYRAKGTDLETFFKTHTRSRTPEVKKSNWRQKHEAFIRILQQSRLPGGTGEHNPPIQDNPDYVTCPHCSRRFAPGPAERHIPNCQHIKSRPPPPPCFRR